MLRETIRSSAAVLMLLALPGLLGCRAARQETPGPEVAEASCEDFQGAPRLVLFLVVDQMRGEYLEHFRPLLQGGLARLSDESFVFTNVHHNHVPTSTATGHATLATGTYPKRHGIIGNRWFSRHENKEINAVKKGSDRTIDWLEAATLGDWLKDRCPGSKVFAASGKDRAAILPGGRRADAAFWYDDEDGYFK
ncbi:MAG: hypothetical protein GY856_27135, partial [bacterium]|nr:hypothetical protein [bacterium]